MQRSLYKRRLSVALSGLLIGVLFCLNALAADIAVYGDSQHNADAHRKVVAGVLSYKPAVVFRVGDQVNDGNDAAQWVKFKAITNPLLKKTEYFPALGNHDKGSPLYFATFPSIKGRRWYSVDRQGVHFIVLDSNSDMKPESRQYRWLEADLKGVKKGIRYKVVLFHHPLFDVGVHKADEKKLKSVLMPLFKKYGVSVVFSGHDHNYQRFEYEGIAFVVTGGGGSSLKDKTRESPYLKKFRKTYHFCMLTPGKKVLKVKVVGTDLEKIDEFSIPAKKPAASVDNGGSPRHR